MIYWLIYQYIGRYLKHRIGGIKGLGREGGGGWVKSQQDKGEREGERERVGSWKHQRRVQQTMVEKLLVL